MANGGALERIRPRYARRRGGDRPVGVHRRHGRLDGECKDVLAVQRLIGDAT